MPKRVVMRSIGEAKAVLLDRAPSEETQEALALLELLAQGDRDIAAGRVKPAAATIARLRRRRASN